MSVLLYTVSSTEKGTRTFAWTHLLSGLGIRRGPEGTPNRTPETSTLFTISRTESADCVTGPNPLPACPKMLMLTIPVIVCRPSLVLRNPSPQTIEGSIHVPEVGGSFGSFGQMIVVFSSAAQSVLIRDSMVCRAVSRALAIRGSPPEGGPQSGWPGGEALPGSPSPSRPAPVQSAHVPGAGCRAGNW